LRSSDRMKLLSGFGEIGRSEALKPHPKKLSL
jgi:hypothetical protein